MQQAHVFVAVAVGLHSLVAAVEQRSCDPGMESVIIVRDPECNIRAVLHNARAMSEARRAHLLWHCSGS